MNVMIGACGAELACATCHLIFEKEMYDTLPEKDPEEDDMLDLAFELTDTYVKLYVLFSIYIYTICVFALLTMCYFFYFLSFFRSRLGCQITVRDDMAGMKVRIPDDGF